VLLEDDFTAMVGAVQLGRRIYDNIHNAMRYLIAVHVPLAGMAFIPLAAGWPFFFFPVHVVFLEFVIDPACSIVFEAERSAAHIMERPPRPASQRLFDRSAFGAGLALGATLLAAVALVYGVALAQGAGENAARAMAFATLVLGNLALILVNRSQSLSVREMAAHPNPALWWIVPGTLAALAAAIYVPGAAGIFRFAPLTAAQVAACVLAAALSVGWFEAHKARGRRRRAAG
jgi:Ca2+-transporting ATPase